MINGFEIEPGIIISKLDLKENDIILVTIDPDIWDLDIASDFFKQIVKSFPNHQVVMTLKGFEINKLKEKEV